MAEPEDVAETRSFLGLAGNYRRFVEGFSQILAPLTKFTRKNVPFVWTKEFENNFQLPKEKLTIAPMLTYQLRMEDL